MWYSCHGLTFSVIDGLMFIGGQLFVNIMCDVEGQQFDTLCGLLIEIPEA